MRLEDEAKRAGGRVESLLGNHEAMNLLHEFRDVAPATYAAFADNRSESRRQRAFDDYAKLVKRRATPGETAPNRDDVDGEPSAGLSSSTSTRSVRAASTAGGCERTRS